jgi:hypothetical protein
MLVVKQATDNYVFLDPVPNHDYPSTGDQAPGFSHAMECYAPEPEDTTTTTEAEETTTTTVEDTTTTTVEDTTTTVEILDSTVTTAPAETTTSSIEDEVLGTEVLPFTGLDNDLLALLAGSLGLLGALVLISSRRIED